MIGWLVDQLVGWLVDRLLACWLVEGSVVVAGAMWGSCVGNGS